MLPELQMASVGGGMQMESHFSACILNDLRSVIATSGDPPSFLKLEQTLREAPPPLLASLHDKILAPLVFLLAKRDLSEREKISLLSSFTLVLSVAQLTDYELFIRSLICCVTQKESSEEVKLASLNVVGNLLSSSHESVINEFVSPKNVSKIGLILSYILGSCDSSVKFRDLRMKSLDVFGDLLMRNRKQKIREEMSAILACFFPGVISCFAKTLMNGDLQNSLVLIATLELLSHFLILLLSPRFSRDLSTSDVESEVQKFVVHRDESWMKKVEDTLKSVVDKTKTVLVQHPNVRVRRSFIYLSRDCVKSFGSTIPGIVVPLIEVIICFLQDPHDDIASISEIVLEELSDRNILTKRTQVELSKMLIEHLGKLAHVIRTKMSGDQKCALKQLSGYLRVVDASQFKSSAVLKKILSDLYPCIIPEIQSISVCTPQTNTYDFIEESSIEKEKVSENFGIAFRNLDGESFSLLSKTVRGFIDDINWATISQILMENLATQGYHRSSVLMTCRLLIQGLEKSSDKLLLADSLNQMSYEVMTFMKEADLSSREDIILVISSLGVLEASARVLGELLDLKSCLYRVLGLAVCENQLVSSSALRTLSSFSTAFGFATTREILSNNCDYVFSDCLIKLRHLSFHPEVTDVLSAAVAYADESFLPYVNDVSIQCEMLLRSYSTTAAVKIFNLFFRIAVRMKTLQTKESPELGDITDGQDKESLGQKISSYIDTLIKESQPESDETGENSPDDTNESQEEAEAAEQEPESIHVDICKRIIHQCVHFLSHSDPDIRLVCLATCRECLEVLPEKALLPAVHDIWDTLRHRLRDSHPGIVYQCCLTICLVSRLSRDFVRRRINQDVVPLLLKWMQKLTDEPPIPNSQEHKLLKTIVSNVPDLLINCCIIPQDRKTTLTFCEMIVKLRMKSRKNSQLWNLSGCAMELLSKQDSHIIYLLTNYLEH